MDCRMTEILEAAIELEKQVGELYMVFHHACPEDAGFWWQLALEEQNHAALLESGRRYFCERDLFPGQLLEIKLAALKGALAEIAGLRQRFAAAPPTCDEALAIAIRLEEAAGELHFQETMDSGETDPASALFQKLNGADKDHAARLRAYRAKSDKS